MIKGLQGGAGISVAGGNTTVPYVGLRSDHQANPLQGMMRISGSDLQVFDGVTWVTMSSSYATVTLDNDTLEILQWARNAMQEDKELDRLAKEHPAVNAALKNMRRAQKQLKTTIILSRDEQTTS